MVVLALTTIARKLTIPYPILLVVGGLALSFVPGLPIIRLDPNLVFFVFFAILFLVHFRVQFFHAFRTAAMGEFYLRMFDDIVLQLGPVSLIVAYLLA